MEIEENIEELKKLFYSDNLTQAGKRELINYYEEKIQELEEEKYKKQYDKALSDLVKAEHDNIKKDKIIEAMAVCILAREIGKTYCQFNEKCTKYEHGRNIYCKNCIIQYFESKVNSSEQ